MKKSLHLLLELTSNDWCIDFRAKYTSMKIYVENTRKYL